MGYTRVYIGAAGALVYLAKFGIPRRMPTATRTASSVKRRPHAEMGNRHCKQLDDKARIALQAMT